MDAADVVDHEELQEVGDVEKGQVEADGHFEDLHNYRHTKVGNGAKQDPADSTRRTDKGEELTIHNDEAINIRFYLVEYTELIEEFLDPRALEF